jgi:hypothetical protein
MPRSWLSLTVLAVMLVIGCQGANEGSLIRSLEVVGCDGVPAVEYQQTPRGVVLSVSVQQCSAGDGRLLAVGEAHELMTRTIWSARTHRFDGLLVTVYRFADDPSHTAARSAEVSRATLVSSLGHRDRDLHGGLAPGRGSSAAWTVLPVVAAVVLVTVLSALVRAARDGRLAPAWMIRF